MTQNLIEKIVQKHAVDLPEDQKVGSGDFVFISPSYVMTHDNTGAVINKFNSIGASKFANRRQVVFTLDHDIQNKSEKNLLKYAKIESFAQKLGNDFYPAGRGIGHQIMVEEGYAWPGTMVVASDSHSNTYGGIGVLGTPVVRTDAASIWATGKTWWKIPEVVKVEFTGQLKRGVTGKDVILSLIGYFNKDEVLNHAIEFCGEGISEFSIDQRLTISNMTTEWGALCGLFPVDEITIDWLGNQIKNTEADHPRLNEARMDELLGELQKLQPDYGANYSKEIVIDLALVQPCVAGPHTLKTVNPISVIEKEKIKINKAYLLSCTNARIEDFAEAAEIINGKNVAEGVDFYIAAASNEIQKEAEKLGYWKTLVNAGAKVLPASCGPCIGLGAGLLEEGEVGISATNRNFKGRMGSNKSESYLGSPATVAASAAAGYITNPYGFKEKNLHPEIKINSKKYSAAEEIKIISGFPPVVEGRLVFCHQDNLNTDDIYPGKYTYEDSLTPNDQAKVVMENYDPEFSTKIKTGDILVGGYNFGTGSSREQAATALKYRGLKMVIAGSFNATYLRNAINNGFLCITAPALVDDLKTKFGCRAPTVYTGINARIDFTNASVSTSDQTYTLSPIGIAAQEIISAGGLENWIYNSI